MITSRVYVYMYDMILYIYICVCVLTIAYVLFKVDCSKFGTDVLVEKFEGDGSGLTSSKDIDWKIGEDITFIVRGQYDGVSMLPSDVNISFVVITVIRVLYYDIKALVMLSSFSFRPSAKMVPGLVLAGINKTIMTKLC